MKKLLIAALTAMGLGLGQSAFFVESLTAQSNFTPSFSLTAAFRGGATQVLGPLDARLGLSLGPLGVNADVLYPVPVGLQSGRLDVGLGLGVAVLSVGGTSATDVALRGILGYELPIQGVFAVRVEPTVAYSFNARRFSFALGLGPRIYLR